MNKGPFLWGNGAPGTEPLYPNKLSVSPSGMVTYGLDLEFVPRYSMRDCCVNLVTGLASAYVFKVLLSIGAGSGARH